MTNLKNDPIKSVETMIINICQQCKTRYSLEEAQKRQMRCCDQPLTQKEERIPMPVGP